MNVPQPPDRRVRGEKHHNAVVTEELVREIRRAPGRYRSLSEQYGISIATISQIRRRRTWKNVS